MNRIRLFLLLSCWLVAACGPPPSGVVSERIIVLGFDGMDPKLTKQWMADGSLPNFVKLSQQGSFQSLATSNPPQSPVAWSSFATGTGPGDHGIYDFLRRDPETYAPAFSISEITPPERVLNLFGMRLPLSDGEIINRRQGATFWSRLESQGGLATVLRVPATYPPEPIHRMFSGMGIPDLLGSQGTYTLFTIRPNPGSSLSASTRVVRLRPNRNGHIETALEGPLHPLAQKPEPLKVALSIDRVKPGIAVNLDETTVHLQPGEWSDWIQVTFKFAGFGSLNGMVRMYLAADYPDVSLYVSPIHIDPTQPVVPLTSPPDYAGKLAQQMGLYHTIGMPEETWSLNEGHLSDGAFLDVVKTTLKERETMFYGALDANDSNLVVGVFVQTDRVAHMFYRGIDSEHPLFADTDQQARDAIHWIYQEADRILGETMRRMGPEDRLMVISDHGFAPFRWAVHVNRWLVDNDYLVLKAGQSSSGAGFAAVDWSQSRAYALGLNGLYINRRGRESQGIVGAAEAENLKQELIRTLPLWLAENTGTSLIRQVFDGALLYPANANGDAPDLVIGYEPGYRASWQTTLGAIPTTQIEPNNRKWSGDHCITPEAVPGVIFTSFEQDHGMEGIGDIAGYIMQNWNPREPASQ
jgi:predicted AlkP superfamily phosphohydrolase/phosphomutase